MHTLPVEIWEGHETKSFCLAGTDIQHVTSNAWCQEEITIRQYIFHHVEVHRKWRCTSLASCLPAIYVHRGAWLTLLQITATQQSHDQLELNADTPELHSHLQEPHDIQ